MIRARKRLMAMAFVFLTLGLLVVPHALGAEDTTTEVTFLPASPVVGETVTVTWTIASDSASPVTFCDPLARRIKSPGAGTWDILDDTVVTSGGSPFVSTLPFTPLVAGTYTVEGAYSGCPTSDPVLNASSGSTLLVVSKADTTVTVTSDLPTPVTGQTITFTATVAAVAPGTGDPTGTVSFYANGAPIPGGQNIVLADDGFGNQIAQATASYNAADSTVSITAAYGGDVNYNGSDNVASPHIQTIVQASTTTVVGAAPAPSVTGQDVTFTATITADAPGSGTPTGTVVIAVEDNTATPVATSAALPLDGSGQASFLTNLMKASGGPYEVIATYSGDVNYNASDNTLAPHSQTVNKADTTLSIDSDNPDPSIEGQPYDVTWTVTVVTPGSDATGAPTGTVQVEDSETTPNTCSDAVENGATGCTLTSTTAMAQTLTATYSGDADYNGSDNTASHTVDSASTSISVNSNVNPQLLKADVIFTATLVPDTPGGPDPTGTVTFKDGATTIGTDSDGSDGWTLTYAFSSAGDKTITVEYSGDSVYEGSTSDPITQTINKLDLVLTITGDLPDPSVVGQSYTVTWSATWVDPNPAAPPVSVSPTGFTMVGDGSGVSCSNSIMDGATGCSIASAEAGTKTLHVDYPGDTYFNSVSATTTHQVDPGNVSIAVTPSNAPWTSGASGTFSASVTAVAPASGTPTGTVTFVIQDSGGLTIDTSGPHLLVGGTATSDSVTLASSQSPVSVEVSYSGDTSFNAAFDDTYSQVVEGVVPGNFTITDHTPDPTLLGDPITVNVAYAGGFPDDGTVAVELHYPPSGCVVLMSTAVNESDTTAGPIVLPTDPDPSCEAGTWDLTATYTPDVGDIETDTVPHTLYRCTSSTTVSFDPSSVYVNEPTTITATVTPVTPPDPPCPATGLVGKTIAFNSKNLPFGATGDFSSDYCILVGGAGSAFCSTVTYTPTASGAACPDVQGHTLVATFDDGDFAGSEAEAVLTVSKRPASVSVVCVPDTVYINQETICTVTVADGTVAPGSTIPTGTVTFDDLGKAGIFDPSDSGSLVHGTYDVVYTPAPGDAGASVSWTAIGAAYGGSPVYCTGDSSAELQVEVRPTEVTLSWNDSAGGNDAIFLHETGTVTITVTDIGPAESASPPEGTLTMSGPVSVPTVLVPVSPNASQAVCNFRKLTMTEAQEFVTVGATYNPLVPQTHGGSQGSTEVSVQKRPTETVVVCDDAVDGNCTVTVTDTASRGTSPSPGGTAVDQGDGSDFCSLAAGAGTSSSCTSIVIGDEMLQPFAVGYMPDDDIHMASYGMDMIERPLVPTGSCGVLHIEDTIFGLNTTCTIIAALQVLLESGAAAADIIADPVWTAIFPGSTVPIGDMISTALTGLSLHGEIAIQTMCTDVDGDGIPGSVEAVIAGLWDHKWDSDGDGMGDLDEIDEAGGDMATSYDASKHTTCACPNPTTADSDGDDIPDGTEQGAIHTNFCNDDTDEDGLNDGIEAGTSTVYPSASGATITPRVDPRDHADPRMADTDGDGLDDAQEFTPGRLATSITDPNYSSYINDADSDDDDLQDGYEDTNGDGRWSGTIGGSNSQGSGETHLCMRDTDGDGLSDGEEVALFGAGEVHVVTPTGSITVPANDTDSDNDGLSDYEEVNITHTDPLDFDTDDDGLWDVNELMATGGTWPARSFAQVSDPLDPDTDDDDIPDNVEYSGTGLGTGHGLGGSNDNECPYVNDDDSDDDGLQDGVEDANLDGTWGVNGGGITIGTFSTQASKGTTYWETDLCNPDTDGDGILDGEEVALLGGAPLLPSRPRPIPGFGSVTPQGVSTVVPVGPDYSGGPLFTFNPTDGPAMAPTLPALDIDSDNDGLSDYEEVHITHTDPLDQDTDNDTLMDADELVAVGGLPGPTPRRAFDQESDPLDINTDDDHLFDPVEGECGNVVNYGTGLSALAGQLGGLRDLTCPRINDADSDDDGVQDGAVIPISRQGPGLNYSYIFIEGFEDVPTADVLPPGVVRTVVTPATGEQSVDTICNACDPDSDSDGLTDGEEVGLGTDPQDWDTDDDGRNDWHEQTGGGPIPSDPFDPDTDDDGLLDSAEVFGSNTTNPTRADTDGDGLCDGGSRTPYMTSGHPTIVVNPICKSCSTPGFTACPNPLGRGGSPDGIGDHPNPLGIGEDENGNGAWDGGETDPNQYDTDGDAVGDGIERLSFSSTRQHMIPTTDLLGRLITVVYPQPNNLNSACDCMDPLNPDSDGDGLTDGNEDLNHDGNFDFLSSDFEYEQVPLPGPPQPNPLETNPCDPDTDDDGLTDYEERLQRQPFAPHLPLPVDNDGDGAFDEDPIDGIDNDFDGAVDEDPLEEPIELTFNPTNPLDHDTDNDWILDGPEVYWICTELACSTLDNDSDGYIDEDPVDGLDNDGDGLLDEDPVDFALRFVPMLDPTSRDSDSDGYIDGLDDDPCNSECIPQLVPFERDPVDTDGDSFADVDEVFAGTHPNDPEDHPATYGLVDLDYDQWIDDRMWLEPGPVLGIAHSVVIDIDQNVLVDFRLQIIQPRDAEIGDFDGDGAEDDVRYVVEYAFADYRVLQPRIRATIEDYDMDLVIDRVVVERP